MGSDLTVPAVDTTRNLVAAAAAFCNALTAFLADQFATVIPAVTDLFAVLREAHDRDNDGFHQRLDAYDACPFCDSHPVPLIPSVWVVRCDRHGELDRCPNTEEGRRFALRTLGRHQTNCTVLATADLLRVVSTKED